MRTLLKYFTFSLSISLMIFVFQFSTTPPVQAQEPTVQDDPPAELERPFRLPFARPSGLDTWLMAQPYGNTSGAYFQRHTTYSASGGIHFGMDLSAPCGTEVVAIADGIVFAVDGPFGSPPHNLMIDHPQLGYASMYGHLLETPAVLPGQQVRQGEVVALVGDSGGICYRRPHLHLEIRDLNHIRKYNPMTLIEANWDNLAMTGSDGRVFMHDLAEPRKWQSLYDQPEAQTGGPIVNDFAETWPFDWGKRSSDPIIPVQMVAVAAMKTQLLAPVSLRSQPGIQQLTTGNCCTRPYWNRESTEVRFVDRPAPDQPLGIWGVSLAEPEAGPQLVTERLGIYSPDGSLVAYPDRDKGLVVVERLADGQKWEIDTQEHSLSFTPDSQGILWIASDDDAPSDSRVETLWLAEIDGSNARAIIGERRTSTLTWLPGDRLLMTRRFGGTADEQLFTLSLKDGSKTTLIDVPRMRGLALSRDRRYLVYYATFEMEAEKNGTWLIDLEKPEKGLQKLPFFGAYRWRDGERLIYIPFDSEATRHVFYEYNVKTGQTQRLLPEGVDLRIANNDWVVSPDGNKIALVAARGTALDGIWVVDIN
jgi:hypothetical protein